MGLSEKSTAQVLQITLLFTAMFSAMGGPALAPALPAIKTAYQTIPDIEFWTKVLVAITGLFSAVGAPLFGWLSDRYGRKPALITALCLWALAGVSGMIPQSFWTLLAGRALLGLGLGGLLVANTAMIADSYSKDKQRYMMGMQSSFASSGIVLSLIISGLLTDIHWRWAFSLFLTGFMILPFAFLSPEPPPRPQTVVQHALPPFVYLIILCFFAFSTMLVFNVIPTQLPFFMIRTGIIKTASAIGLVLAVMPVASAVAGRIYARMSRHMNLWNLFMVGGALMLSGFYMISFSNGLTVLLFSLVFIGIGFGITMPHLNIVLTHIVPPQARGRVMGMMTSAKFMGLFVSPFVFQPLLSAFGYHTILRVAGGFIFFAAFVIWTLRFRYVRDKEKGLL